LARTIAPAIKAGKRLLIAAHGNSLRAMVKYLDNVSDEEITELNIPPVSHWSTSLMRTSNL